MVSRRFLILVLVTIPWLFMLTCGVHGSGVPVPVPPTAPLWFSVPEVPELVLEMARDPSAGEPELPVVPEPAEEPEAPEEPDGLEDVEDDWFRACDRAASSLATCTWSVDTCCWSFETLARAASHAAGLVGVVVVVAELVDVLVVPHAFWAWTRSAASCC